MCHRFCSAVRHPTGSHKCPHAYGILWGSRLRSPSIRHAPKYNQQTDACQNNQWTSLHLESTSAEMVHTCE
jgi:hypothetical protein